MLTLQYFEKQIFFFAHEKLKKTLSKVGKKNSNLFFHLTALSSQKCGLLPSTKDTYLLRGYLCVLEQLNSKYQVLMLKCLYIINIWFYINQFPVESALHYSTTVDMLFKNMNPINSSLISKVEFKFSKEGLLVVWIMSISMTKLPNYLLSKAKDSQWSGIYSCLFF